MSTSCVSIAHFSKDTADLLKLMVSHGVRFLVVGGEAVIFHGYARVTGDIDLFYERTEQNTRRLYDGLREFWQGRIPGVSSAVDFMEEGVIVQFGVPPNRIDLINRIDGVTFEAAWRGRVLVAVKDDSDAFSLNYIGLSGLLTNKKATGRPKDLADVAYLDAMAKKRGTVARALRRAGGPG